MRKNNEDAVGEDKDMGLLILADGMGGYNAGEIASGLAISTVHETVKKEWKGLKGGEIDEASGNSREALRLTNQGLKLMERAVEGGTMEAAALAIPYGNLAAMHEELGDPEQAKWCAELAARYEDSATK